MVFDMKEQLKEVDWSKHKLLVMHQTKIYEEHSCETIRATSNKWRFLHSSMPFCWGVATQEVWWIIPLSTHIFETAEWRNSSIIKTKIFNRHRKLSLCFIKKRLNNNWNFWSFFQQVQPSDPREVINKTQEISKT